MVTILPSTLATNTPHPVVKLGCHAEPDASIGPYSTDGQSARVSVRCKHEHNHNKEGTP